MNESGAAWVPDRRFALLLALLTAVGLVLRLLAAQGALWLDEAWSAIFARDAASPAAVFFAVNHDNNHFANTLWLQLVGWNAPPLLSRGLSILSGTATVAIAGLIGARRNPLTGLIAAALFAISPMLLTYGAEARGYAPMVLALMVAVLLVDRALAGIPLRGTPIWLGVAAVLGMLSHLTMIFGIGALTGWVAIVSARRFGPVRAIAVTADLMGRALLAVLAVGGLVVLAAWSSPAGYRIGGYTPFAFESFVGAVGMMIGQSLGAAPMLYPTLVVAAAILVPLALWRLPALRNRAPFYGLLIVGLPVAVAILQIGNGGFARYFITASVALLLLTAEVLALAMRAGRVWRIAGAVAFAAILVGSLGLDRTIIAYRRGDPGVAIATMRLRAPEGAAVLITGARSSAVLEVAAASTGYRLQVVPTACGVARFLFVDQDGHQPMSRRRVHCGVGYGAIAGRGFSGLSGQTWQLYERETR